MTTMDVSQLVSCIAYLKCYLQESITQCASLREVNEQKDAKINEMQAKIEGLDSKIIEQNREILELTNFLADDFTKSNSSLNDVQPRPSSEDIKKCQNEMIVILKERCDDLTNQLQGARAAWQEKCILIEKYRTELTDVSNHVTSVHKKLSEMKIWQKQIETYYAALKENQESIQLATSEDNFRITSEITDLKRIQNALMANDDIKENVPMNGTGDGIGKSDRTVYHMNQVTVERNQTVNHIEIYSKVAGLNNQMGFMKPTAVVNPTSMGIRFLKNIDFFDTVKTKFQNLMLYLTGCDNKNKKDSLIRYGVPATIVCCFVTGTLLTQMILFPANNRLAIDQLGGSKGYIISAPFRR